MTYHEALEHFSEQCTYEPTIINPDRLRPFDRIIILGMGGSRLSPDILNMYRPDLEVHIHSDYDLPALSPEHLEKALIIANSYSGDTAEPLSGAKLALAKGYNLAIVTTGGELGRLAKEHIIPHIITPDDSLPHRLALGYNLAGLLVFAGLDLAPLKACAAIKGDPVRAKALADDLKASIPLVYVPERFNELGYIWKIVFNETAKIPAFCNRYPELDHNEIAGFDAVNAPLFSTFKWIMIRDGNDEYSSRRADATAALLRSEGLFVEVIELEGPSVLERIMSSALLAHWTGVYLAEQKGIDPMATLIIEEFKKLMN